MDEEEKKTGGDGWMALIIFFVIGLIIMIGYFYLLHISNSKGNKQMKSLVSKVPLNNSSFWKLTHFILFFVLGILFPRSDLIVLGIGIIWELIEHNLSLTAPKIKRKVDGKVEYIQWWHGKPDDIIIDFFGYYVGKSINFSINNTPSDDFWKVGLQ